MITPISARTGLFGCALRSMLLAGCIAATSAHAQSYTWQNVKIVGGGFVSGIIAHPGQQGLFYARTDVGGAYRYNSSTSTWVPLNDWTTPANWYQMGVDSIAIDPNNTNKLYMAVGEYAAENWDGNGAILVSSNQGASFTSVSMPFKVGGNDGGRNGGERMQVDPNLGSVLYYGTYQNGLYTSTNSGSSWSQVTSFPVTGATNGAGVIFVVFDKSSGQSGKATPRIFVGVSQTGTSLYVSTNGGSSWSAVSGAPTGLYPTRGAIGVDGNLYVTYGNAIGTDGMTSGQVWKYNIANATWTNITPPNPNNYSYGFSGLALDPEISGGVVVTSMDRWWPGDTMWRSTNGGSTWTDVGASASRDASLSPWVNWGSSSPGFGDWPSAVVIDPFNSNRAFYGTGQTVWTTSNLTNSSTNWTIGANGIEETVPEQLVSPTSGAPLISAVGDICGFVHTSLTTSPASGYETNPSLNACTGIDWAKSAPSTIVRVGYNGNGVAQFGGYSTNQGASWTAFGSAAGSTNGGGSVAISADGGTIVWAPSDVAPSYSTNNGSSWTSTSLPTGVVLLSDGYNANLFYAYNPSTGTFYASSNKGVSWYTAYSGLPANGKPYAATGIQGDVWLATPGGLYHSTSSGSGWTQLGSVTSANAVSTGKAASGASYQTLYLSGTVNGTTGVFRSTNAGSSWTQINNAANQWGGISLVTGDPRTFGTVYLGTGGRGIVYGTSPN
jgi:hypothetical protein